MLFTPENCQLILQGRKTQTRRLAYDGEIVDYNDNSKIEIVYTPYCHIATGKIMWRKRYKANQIYALCPGRGKPQAGKIKLIHIGQELLQDISDSDICAEVGVLQKWPGPGPEPYPRQLRTAFSVLWDSINTRRGTHWANNPLVWVLTFELCQPKQ